MPCEGGGGRERCDRRKAFFSSSGRHQQRINTRNRMGVTSSVRQAGPCRGQLHMPRYPDPSRSHLRHQPRPDPPGLRRASLRSVPVVALVVTPVVALVVTPVIAPAVTPFMAPAVAPVMARAKALPPALTLPIEATTNTREAAAAAGDSARGVRSRPNAPRFQSVILTITITAAAPPDAVRLDRQPLVELRAVADVSHPCLLPTAAASAAALSAPAVLYSAVPPDLPTGKHSDETAAHQGQAGFLALKQCLFSPYLRAGEHLDRPGRQSPPRRQARRRLRQLPLQRLRQRGSAVSDLIGQLCRECWRVGWQEGRPEHDGGPMPSARGSVHTDRPLRVVQLRESCGVVRRRDQAIWAPDLALLSAVRGGPRSSAYPTMFPARGVRT